MNSLKTIMWIAVTFLIIFLLFKFLFFITPFIIIIALVGFLVIKGKKLFSKEENINNNTFYSNESTTKNNSVNDEKVIDVDYKEVDK